MGHFVRQSINGGRCVALNQYYKSIIWDEVFNINSIVVDVNGNKCETLEKFFENAKKHRKIIEDKYE